MVSEALKKNSALVSMDLSSDRKKRGDEVEKENRNNKERSIVSTENRIGQEGIRMLCEALKSNSVLIRLDLSGITEDLTEGGKRFSEVIVKSM